MAVNVLSALTFIKVDQQGNPWTEGWFTVEYRAAYIPGGEPVDLSAYYKQLIYAEVNPISGATFFSPRVNQTDLPTTTLPAQSTRLQLDGIAGGGISVASGTQLMQSGALVSGNISNAIAILFSGTIAVNAASGQSTAFRAELLSGVAVSGTRAVLHTLGY